MGLNYAVIPKVIPTANIIAATEATAKQLDTNTADKLRAGAAKFYNPPNDQLGIYQATYAKLLMSSTKTGTLSSSPRTKAMSWLSWIGRNTPRS